MDFKLTEEQQMIRDTIRDFAENEVRPGVAERDKNSEFPYELMKKLGEMGFLGVLVPEEYGGSQLDNLSYAIVIEELARVDPALAVTVSVHNSVACYPIVVWGSEEQKRKYLPKMATGEWLGAFSLTEPQAGSDAANQKTKAIKKGDKYILNGTKAWCTNGPVADVLVVVAVTDPSKGAKGISAFIVEKNFPGIKAGKVEDKMGLRSSKTSEIILEDCEVPEENLLGGEGMGYKVALTVLGSSRISIGAQALGIAQGAFEEAVKYSKIREAFSQPICNFQGISFMIADMATKIEAARNLVYYAAYKKDEGKERIAKYSSMAKMYASDIANEVVAKAVQIHGGYGYSKEYPVERFFRDARVTTIYEGTNEIQRIVIARELMREGM